MLSSPFDRNRTPLVMPIVVGVVLTLTLAAGAALRLVESVPGDDFNVAQNTIEQTVVATTTEPLYGVGLTARWTAVVADQGGGTFPWPLDLSANVYAPSGAILSWPQIGGDRTIADFPLQDANSGFLGVNGQGEFTWLFDTAAPAPYVSGLREVQYHFLTFADEVVEVSSGTTEGGPLWDRPFFIDGVSGLGPVSYHAVEFTAAVPGKYTFESVVVGENNFNYVYQGGFDSAAPLENLLDYGLGNGQAPNGTPAGTSLIDVLLLPDTTYTYVTSQWSATSTPVPFTTTVTGPGSLVWVCVSCAAGDFDGDGLVDLDDYAFFADCLGGPHKVPFPDTTGATAEQCVTGFDFDDDEDVDLADFAAFVEYFGNDS